MMDLDRYIARISNFPKDGVLFYDISPLLADADAWQVTIGRLSKEVSKMQPDLIAGIESRGFLTAAPLAAHLGLGFVMARKPGKLPGKVVSQEYELEYGSDEIQVKEGFIKPGQNVVIADDLLATGGTLKATAELVKKCGANVTGAVCIIELKSLKGRDRVDFPCTSLLSYDE